MKQEFLNRRIVLHNADCLEVMGGMGDKEVDLILSDPPFGGGCNAASGGVFEKYNTI